MKAKLALPLVYKALLEETNIDETQKFLMKNIPKILKISKNYYNQLKRYQVFLWSYYVNII